MKRIKGKVEMAKCRLFSTRVMTGTLEINEEETGNSEVTCLNDSEWL